MAHEHTFRDLLITSGDIGIRRIGVKDLWQSLREGYDDYNAKPSFVYMLILIYPLFALLFTLFLIGGDFWYLAYPMIAGFTLLGPVVCVGLYEMSRRREAGLDLSWRSAFDFVHSSRFAPVAALSVLMMLVYIGWVYMAHFIYIGLFGAAPPTSISAFANQLTSTEQGAALMFHGTLVGFLFAFTALAMSVVSFPLLLDKPATSLTAISVSFRAVTANPLAMGAWGLIVVALLIAGSIFFLIGLAAVLPILGHATWHLYRKLVES